MNRELAPLVEVYWDLELERSPFGGLIVGDYRYADRAEDISREAEDGYILRLESIADAATALQDSTLTRDERITRGVMVEEARGSAGELRSRLEEFAVDPATGTHVTLLQVNHAGRN